MAELAPDLRQRLQTLRILWASLTGSVVMFAVVSVVQHGAEQPSDLSMLYAMVGAGCATLVARAVLTRQMQQQAFKNVSLPLAEEPDPDQDSMFFDSPPTRKVVAEPVRARALAFGRLQTPFILAMALSEAIALYGFMLAHLGYPLYFAAPFFGVSLLLNALRFPRLDAFLGPLERQLSARIPRDR